MENNETYLNHPTFGLLFKVCLLEESQELFTTLYAQRLFFVVKSGASGFAFQSVGRSEARLLVENRMRSLRRLGSSQEYQELLAIHKRMF